MTRFKLAREVLSDSFRILSAILHRPRAVLVLLVLPLMLMTLLGLSFNTMFERGYDVKDVRAAAIFDFEPAKPSEYLKAVDGENLISGSGLIALDDIKAMDFKQLILSDFLQTDILQSFASVQELSKAEAFKLLRKDKLDILFVFDETFYSHYIINTATTLKLPTEIRVVTSDDDYLKKHISEQVMAAFAVQMEKTWDVKNVELQQVVASGVPFNRASFESALEDLFAPNLGPRAVTYKSEIVSGRRAMASKDYYPAAMLAMFWLFTATYLSRWPMDSGNALQKAPFEVNHTRAWLALALAFIWLGALQLALTMGWSTVIIKTIWPLTLINLFIALVGLSALACMSVMLGMISMVRANTSLSDLLESIGIFAMAFAGGSFIPLDMLPSIFKIVSKLTPNGLLLNAYVMTYQGYTLWQIRWELWILAGMGAVALILGLWQLKRTGR